MIGKRGSMTGNNISPRGYIVHFVRMEFCEHLVNISKRGFGGET